VKKIALIDNYDSFTYNLVHLIEKVSDPQVDVFLNDKITLDELSGYQNIVLSPGPGLPKDAGIMPEFLKQFSSTKNILGVCLGMQAIGESFNSPLKNLNTVMHGIATPVTHFKNDFLFKDIPSTFNAGRYHSWVIDNTKIDPSLEILAKDEKGEIMAIKHKVYNIRGVQFHPESILSEFGETLMKNWINNF
jgi:anthranilate synthase component 2